MSGTVTISAESGGTASILGVQFAVDGNNLGAEDVTYPYSIDWATTLLGNGVHAITAVARDPTQNEAQCGPVNVTVSNLAPPATAGLVLALGLNEGTGTATADVSGHTNHGVLSGPAWVNGRYGKALSFDGVNDLVTVTDAASINLVGPMTLEAWVNPRTLASWRSVILKERPSSLAYALYGNTDTNKPSVEMTTGTNLDARGSTAACVQRVEPSGCHLRRHDLEALPERHSGRRPGGDRRSGRVLESSTDWRQPDLGRILRRTHRRSATL